VLAPQPLAPKTICEGPELLVGEAVGGRDKVRGHVRPTSMAGVDEVQLGIRPDLGEFPWVKGIAPFTLEPQIV
jgi:hypothetical protein